MARKVELGVLSNGFIINSEDKCVYKKQVNVICILSCLYMAYMCGEQMFGQSDCSLRHKITSLRQAETLQD